MKERLKAPELRFDGFTDDWEQRKFADFIDVKSGKEILSIIMCKHSSRVEEC